MSVSSWELAPEHLARVIDLLPRIANEMPTAIIEAVEALAREPATEIEGTYLLAVVAMRAQDIASAIALLERCLELRPSMREAAEALGIAYALAARMTDSLFYAKLALTMDWHPQIKNLWPESFGVLGDYFYNVEVDPQFRQGMTLYKAGSWRSALHMFQQVVTINPERQDARRFIAACHLALKDWSSALKELETLAEAGLIGAEELRLRAQLDLALGRGFEALVTMRRAAQLTPENHALHAEALALLSVVHPPLTRSFVDLIPARSPSNPYLPADGTPPRIGFVLPHLSAFESLVPLSDLLAALIAAGHDVHAYINQEVEDTRSHILSRSGAILRAVGAINDEALALTFEGDEIHVLIDMTPAGQPRRLLTIAKHIPALQIAWAASEDALCSNLFDIVLADQRLAPFFASIEQLQFLPTRLDPHNLPSPPAPEAAKTKTGFTIGLALAPGDMSADRIEALAECLLNIPESRLFLLDYGYADLVAMSDLYAGFARYGLGERITIPDFTITGEDTWTHSAHKLDILVIASASGAEIWGWRARSVGLPVVILADRSRPLSAMALLALPDTDHTAALTFTTTDFLARLQTVAASTSDTVLQLPPADIDPIAEIVSGLQVIIHNHFKS